MATPTVTDHRFPNVFLVSAAPNHPLLCTLNYAPNLPNSEHFDFDEIVNVNGIEYRVWNVFSCFLAASVVGGITNIHVGPTSKVLCIDCSPRTISSCSDIVANDGRVYCVNSSPSECELTTRLQSQRGNIVSICGNPQNPEYESIIVEKVDTIIVNSGGLSGKVLEMNAKFLKEEGKFVAILKRPEGSTDNWYDEKVREVRQYFRPMEMLTLEPFFQDLSVLVGSLKPMSVKPTYSELEELVNNQQREISLLKERVRELEELATLKPLQ